MFTCPERELGVRDVGGKSNNNEQLNSSKQNIQKMTYRTNTNPSMYTV